MTPLEGVPRWIWVAVAVLAVAVLLRSRRRRPAPTSPGGRAVGFRDYRTVATIRKAA